MFAPSFFAPLHSGSSVVARVAASATPVLLASGNMIGRRDLHLFNHGNASLHIGYGPEVSVNFFDVKITSGSYYELPKPVHTGEIWGIWDSANGYVMVTDRKSEE